MKDLNRKRVAGTKPRDSIGPKNFNPSKAAVMVKSAMMVSALLVCAATLGGGIGFGVKQGYLFLTTNPFFAVKDIEVSGVEKLDRNKVIDIAGLKQGQNIFTIDSDRAVELIAANPWIKGVTVRKQFPDRIVIRVVERKAGAMVRNSEFWLVDEEGEIFKKAEWTDGMDYPVITVKTSASENGVDRAGLEKAMTLLKLAGKSGQLPASKISEVVVAEDGRVTLFTTGGAAKVDLSGEDMERQWATLETVLADVRNNGMTPVSVNLNYPSGAAVKMVPTGARTLVADSRPSERNP